MLKTLIGSALACGVLFTAAPAFAQFGGGCTRADLQKATDGYVAAQTTADPTKMPMNLWVQYTEAGQDATMSTGILSKPQKIDFHRSLLDPQTCTSFTEVVITGPAHLLGALVRVGGGYVSGLDMIIAEPGDWRFNAADALKYESAEVWTEIPPGERDSRQALIDAANAYLDHLSNQGAAPPLASSCARVVNGSYATGCAVSTGLKLADRSYVVDESLGGVAVVSTFAGGELEDAHVFRIEKGKIRYVDALTPCQPAKCGFQAQ